MNNPVRFTDPSGHACVEGTSYCVDPVTRRKSGSLTRYGELDKEKNKTTINIDPREYVGPIPDAIIVQLVAQGADPEFLATVVIHNKQDDEWRKFCRSNALAVTWYNTIYFCNTDIKYFDPNNPTSTLLHELIHVSQFQKYPEDVLEELQRTASMKQRDERVQAWNDSVLSQLFGTRDWEPYNPYVWSWVEIQGNQCGDAFRADPGLPLDRLPCNLEP